MSTTEALFLDARTRADQEARVELSNRTLRVLSLGGETLAEWPYEKLRVINRGANFGKNFASFIVGHEGNDISRLTIFRPELREELASRSPSFKRQVTDGLFSRFCMWMGWV